MDNFSEHSKILDNGARRLGIPLSGDMTAMLLLYMQELKEWNTKFNLTSIMIDKEILVKHFLDSLAPSRYLPERASILDLGSGAGLPGIPLKIVRPDIAVTLLDSSRKKIHFQKHIIRTLRLRRIYTLRVQAEHGIDRYPDMQSHYDAVLSRAFSSLRLFIEIGKRFLKENGLLIAFKGPAGTTEISRLKPWLDKKSLTIESVQYSLPYLEQKRMLCFVRPRWGQSCRNCLTSN